MGGSQRLALGEERASRTACARVLVRGGIDEKTGEALSASGGGGAGRLVRGAS